MKKSLISLAFAMTSASSVFAANINNESANVSMDVALYASITGLDDIVLTTTNGVEGDGSIHYTASEDFNLESNGQVVVSVVGSTMNHASLPEADTGYSNFFYSVDGGTAVNTNTQGSAQFTTASNSTHNSVHNLSLTRTTGTISGVLAGEHRGTLSITVSGL